MSSNVCVIFGDESCGAVDCVNEAATDVSLPTIVLDGREGGLRNSISQFLLSSDLSSWNMRSLIRIANVSTHLIHRAGTTKSIVGEYLNSLSDEAIFALFQSFLERYNPVDINLPIEESPMSSPPSDADLSQSSPPSSPSSPQRSCSIILRISSLSSVSESDLAVLQAWQSAYPSIFLFLSCSHGPLSEYEEIPRHAIGLYVCLLRSGIDVVELAYFRT